MQTSMWPNQEGHFLTFLKCHWVGWSLLGAVWMGAPGKGKRELTGGRENEGGWVSSWCWLALALPSPLPSTFCSHVASVPTRLGLHQPLASLDFLSLRHGSVLPWAMAQVFQCLRSGLDKKRKIRTHISHELCHRKSLTKY